MPSIALCSMLSMFPICLWNTDRFALSLVWVARHLSWCSTSVDYYRTSANTILKIRKSKLTLLKARSRGQVSKTETSGLLSGDSVKLAQDSLLLVQTKWLWYEDFSLSVWNLNQRPKLRRWWVISRLSPPCAMSMLTRSESLSFVSRDAHSDA